MMATRPVRPRLRQARGHVRSRRGRRRPRRSRRSQTSTVRHFRAGQVRGAQLGDAPAQFGHAADPAIVVLGFQLGIIRNIRMRQDGESSARQARDRRVDALLGGQHAIHVRAGEKAPHRHAGGDTLRAQHRDADAVILAGDGKAFGKADGRVLGGGIHRRADLAQQPRGRNRVQEIARPALHHARQRGTRGIDMRHDMHAPTALPRRVRRGGRIVEIRIGRNDTGIAAEQADRAHLFRLAHQGDDVVLDATSQWKGGGVGCRWRMAVSRAAASCRSAQKTCVAPRPAARRASSRPMPLPAPVTMTILPVISMSVS